MLRGVARLVPGVRQRVQALGPERAKGAPTISLRARFIGQEAEVLGPPELRARLATLAGELHALYAPRRRAPRRRRGD